jgi:hypothetical protein
VERLIIYTPHYKLGRQNKEDKVDGPRNKLENDEKLRGTGLH